jgi:hypothetical protein
MGIAAINLVMSKEARMEETTIREPEPIRQDCARKLLLIVRGPKARAVLGYFLGEVWAMPKIADLRLTIEGRVVARIEGETGYRIGMGERKGLISFIHCHARMAGLDGDELGYLLAQVARIKREE